MGNLCQSCEKNEAKIHFTEIKDGEKTELHICEACAHEKNMLLAFPSLLGHIMKGGPDQSAKEADTLPSACPGCGLTYADFKAKGRLGCPTCYTAFAPVLTPLLEKVHGSRRHVGNSPVRLEPDAETSQEFADLEESLTTAVESEDYERAAELRDEIRILRETSGQQEGTEATSET
jgi:protein arginine kinase activator